MTYIFSNLHSASQNFADSGGCRFVRYKLVGCERAISWNLFISYYGCAGFSSDREFFEIIVLSAAMEFFLKFRRIRGGVEEAFKYLILGRGAKRCTVCS